MLGGITRLPEIEILYFDGCPNLAAATALVEKIAHEYRPSARIQRIEVADADEAMRLRFLGSPTVRVNGRDVEPGAADRTDYTFSCRLHRTDRGYSGEPDEQWVREALATATARAPRTKACV